MFERKNIQKKFLQHKKQSFVFFGVLFIGQISFALTWEQAKESLNDNNYKLKTSFENINIARNDLSKPLSQLYPIVSLRGAAERFLQEDASLGFRSFLGPRLTWSLYQGGKIKNTIKQSRININKQRTLYGLNQAEQESQLRQVFANAVYAKKNIELAKRSLQRAKNNSRYIRLRYKGGQEYVWVFQSSQKNILESEANLIQSQQEAKKALFSLRQMIGQEEVQSIDAISEEHFSVPKNIETIDIKKYLGKHPELRMAQQDSDIAKLNHKVAKADRLPSLLFRTDFIIADTDDSQVFPFWYAGINFSVPIFESGRYKKAAQNAKVKFRQSQRLLEQKQQQQEQNIEQKISNYQWALKNLDVAKINLESMNNKYKLFKKQYREGLVPYVQWDSAQKELRAAESQWIQALQFLQVEYAKLLLALGVTEDEFKNN
ncbi:TolC family protein [bacterium]|nr:TolC family protein [bacterium]